MEFPLHSLCEGVSHARFMNECSANSTHLGRQAEDHSRKSLPIDLRERTSRRSSW